MSIPAQQTKAERLLDSIGEVDILDSEEFANRLQEAALSTSQMARLVPYFNRSDANQKDCMFDGVNCSDGITQLAVASTAAVIPKVQDSRNFHSLTNAVCIATHPTSPPTFMPLIDRAFQQDQASQIPISYIQKLITPIFSQHINEQLAQDGLEPLNVLWKDASLVQEYNATVTNKLFFDPFGERPDFHYAMTVLFVYEYFARGPGFVMPTDPQELHAQAPIQAWNTAAPIESLATEDLRNAAIGMSFAMSSIFNTSGLASADAHEYAFALVSKAVLYSGLPRTSIVTSSITSVNASVVHKTIFDNIDIQQYQALSYRLLDVWQSRVNDNVSGFWVGGVRGAEAVSTNDDEPNYGDGLHMIRTTTYGKDLADWVSANSGQSYVNKGVNVNNKETSLIYIGPGAGSCFIAGTKIYTAKGSLNIENLEAGTQVLTRAQPAQWGVRSNEKVRTPAPNTIYGFNGEKPFFTSGHVFFTSTGLRAVNPAVARRENPWIDVGKLKLGHHLVYSEGGETYRNVEIKTINSAPCNEEYVYGVHLREGLRSYHANGYLTAVNYPEITVSSVGDLLATLPSQTKLKFLSQFKELTPILDRLGGQTVLQALERESSVKSIHYGGQAPTHHPFVLRDLTMPYTLRFRDSKQHGPSIELYSGVLYIDGNFCEHATFKSNTLAWSRKLSNGKWEHAHCKFYSHGKQAKGWLNYDAGHYRKSKNPSRTHLAFRLVPSTITGRRQTPHKAVASHHVLQNTVMNGSITSRRQDGKGHGAAIQLESDDDDTETAQWSLQYDGTKYDRSKPISTWTPNQSIGTISVDVDDDYHINFASMRYDPYDQILAALSKHSKAEQPDTSKLDLSTSTSIYNHQISYDISNLEHHDFTMTSAESILMASDEYNQWIIEHPNHLEITDIPPTRNLHFTTIGMEASFTLPLLMQTIRIEMLPGGERMVGIIREYDPYSDGQNGVPHYMTGNFVDSMSMSLQSAMVAPAKALAKASRSPLTAHAEAHSLALSLATAGADDDDTVVDSLAEIPYDQSNINSEVQTLMSNVMQWHMDAGDRQTFFGTSQPTGLPHQFTTDIENSATAEWLKNTYANAYIGQILTQQDGSIRDSLKFTAQEKKNVRYFWNGKGEGCLSRSQIYKNLERAMTRFKIRSLYQPVADAYNAMSGAGGKLYSDKLFQRYTSLTGISQASAVPTTGNTAMLTKLGAIMDALDSGDLKTVTRKYNPDKNGPLTSTITLESTNSNQLAFLVMGYRQSHAWQNPYWALEQAGGIEAGDQYLQDQWLQDTLIDIVISLIENNQAFEQDVLDAMGKDIDAFGAKQKDWADLSSKQKAQLVVGAMGNRLYKFIQGMGIAFGWVKTAGGWVAKNVYSVWKKGSAAVGDAAEAAVANDPPPTESFVTGPLMKGCFVILGLTALGVAIWNCSDKWSTSNTADRGQMISSIFAAFKQLASFGTDALESILRYGSGKFSAKTEQLICNTFDSLIKEVTGDLNATIAPTEGGILSVPKDYLRAQAQIAEQMHDNPDALVDVAEGDESGLFDLMTSLTENLQSIVDMKMAFNIARGALQVLGYVVSIAVAVFMTWQLVNDWDKMDEGHRVFQTIQVVLACIEAAASLFMLGVSLHPQTASSLYLWPITI